MLLLSEFQSLYRCTVDVDPKAGKKPHQKTILFYKILLASILIKKYNVQ